MLFRIFYRFTLAVLILAMLLAGLSVQRVQAANIVVTTNADNLNNDGLCSLREAVANANEKGKVHVDCDQGTGFDLITFDSGVTNITLGSSLPSIKESLIINGGDSVKLNGGGVLRLLQVNNKATLTLIGITITGGYTTGNGGGVLNQGSLVVQNSTFSNNSALSGGAIYSSGASSIIENTSFTGNSAQNSGGAVFISGGTHTITNTTFYNNQANGTASAGGGGILVNTGTVTVTNSTFAGNGSAAQGGGVYRVGGTLTLLNSIVANSTGGENCAGTITNGGGNLVWGDSTCPGIQADPKLQPLANNSGPTQTMALGNGSAAINLDKANCPTTDQRGLTRRIGFCDSGAFEAQPASVSATSGTPQIAVYTYPFTQPFVATVNDGYGNMLGGVPVTFTAPASGASAVLSGTNVTTGVAGTASVTATANNIVGSYTVYAQIAGGWLANFSLTNIELEVLSVTRASANPTNAASVNYTVRFHVPVASVDETDFSLTTSPGVIAASVTGVSGSGAVYTVGVNTGTGDGTIRLDVIDDDSISDANGYRLGGIGAGNGNFTDGEIYTIDKTPPNTTINSGPAILTTNTSASFDFTSSEANSTFECSLDSPNFNTCQVTYTGIPEGAHIFRVRAIDQVGNTDPTPAQYNWTIDTTAPTLNLPADITAEATGPSGATVNFTVTASDTIDPDPVVICTPASGDPFSLGVTTVDCIATDAAGNSASDSFSITVTDTAEPSLNLPANMTVEATGPSGAVVTFTVTASDAVDPNPAIVCTPASGATFPLGATTVDCTATDAANNSTSGSFSVTVQDTTAPSLTLPAAITVEATGPSGAVVTFSVTASDLVDPNPAVACIPASGTTFPLGTTTVNCTATDATGNSAPGSFSVTVQDTTPPDTFITNPPSNPTNSTIAIFTITSSEPGSSFECRLDGAAFASCTNPANYPGLVNGAHTFNVRATDLSGNTDPSPASFNWTVNTIGPTVTIDTYPANPTNNTDANISITVMPGGVGLANTNCWIDSDAPSDCTSGNFSAIVTQGSHTFHVSTQDLSGNTANASYTWVVDTTSPSAQVAALPAFESSLTFTVNWSGSDNLSGIATYDTQVQVDGASWTDWLTGTVLTNSSYTGENGKTYAFRVRALDHALNSGNWSALSSTTVDTTAPTALMDSPQLLIGHTYLISWSGTDGVSGIAYYIVEIQEESGAWTIWQNNTIVTSAQFTPTPGRHYHFRVHAIDQAGNVGGLSQSMEVVYYYKLFVPLVMRVP